MRKTLTIVVKSNEEMLDDFRRAFKAVRARRPVAKQEGVYFSSLEAVRNFLTRERLALLRAIRMQRPGSVYELAKVVGRDLKNVQDDIKLLEAHGLVEISEARRGQKRKVKVPRAPFEEITLKIAV
jgi:predicted transcriptional regulator